MKKYFFCLLKAVYRGLEQFSRWAKLRWWLWPVVFSGEEEITALSCTKAWMGRNILIFKDHPTQEHVACWGDGNTGDCIHPKNRLEKCWCFRCSESFPEQFDRVTWEAWCCWVCIFRFRTALMFEACVKEQVLKGGQSYGQSVIKSVIKSCSQMLLSVLKFFMYFYLEDVSFNGLMALRGGGWVSAMKLVGSFLTGFQERRVGPVSPKEMFRIPTPQTTCFKGKILL